MSKQDVAKQDVKVPEPRCSKARQGDGHIVVEVSKRNDDGTLTAVELDSGLINRNGKTCLRTFTVTHAIDEELAAVVAKYGDVSVHVERAIASTLAQLGLTKSSGKSKTHNSEVKFDA